MFFEPGLSPKMKAEIDTRSNELIDEFRKHAAQAADEIKRHHPELVEREGGIDERRIFEGWAIQKLASLQLLVIDLSGRVAALEANQRR